MSFCSIFYEVMEIMYMNTVFQALTETPFSFFFFFFNYGSLYNQEGYIFLGRKA